MFSSIEKRIGKTFLFFLFSFFKKVYIIAGPERSGTSWLFNAVRLLLIHEKSPYGPADSYRLNHIKKNDLTTRLIEANGRPLVIRTMRVPDTDWAEDLEQLGHGYFVFVSHRDLRDIIDDSLAIGKIFK